MDILQQRIAAVVAKHEAHYGAQWDAAKLDRTERTSRWNHWKLATCVKQVKTKYGDVLVNVGETVLYDPNGFRRHPNHHRPRFRKLVFATIFADRGLTEIGCNTSVRADHFDFGTEPVNVVDIDEYGQEMKL